MNHYNCIYMFINKTNDKKYIGQAKDFKKKYNTLANNKQGYNISSGGSNGNNFIGKSE